MELISNLKIKEHYLQFYSILAKIWKEEPLISMKKDLGNKIRHK